MSTYDEREKQRYGGMPVECYRFAQSENLWLLTSADREITLPIGRFTPETITRSACDFSKEDSAQSMDVILPRTSPVAALFIGNVPSSPLWLTIYRAHRGDESEYVAAFTGRVVSARFTESEVHLAATSITSFFSRNVPVVQMQTPCNHVLYSAECGANPTSCRDSITVTTVDGVTIVSNDFGLRADHWFRGGRLETADGESRLIAEHVGDTVTLISPVPGLASLDVVWAYWGCDHLESTCQSKFGRLENHLGWSRIPGRNPFGGSID